MGSVNLHHHIPVFRIMKRKTQTLAEKEVSFVREVGKINPVKSSMNK